MKRLPDMTTALFFSALWSVIGLGVVAPVQAETLTDTFELKVVVKEWCEGNPKFFENFTVKIDPKNFPNPSNTILTFKRDAGNTGDLTDVAATINTKGASADIDAMTLNGLAFFSNKGQSKAEFVLSGVNPANDDHFMTIRGQATFDKFKNLTKLTGTFVTEGTDTYTIDRKTGAQSGPVECFSSGTFVTGKPIPTP